MKANGVGRPIGVSQHILTSRERIAERLAMRSAANVSQTSSAIPLRLGDVARVRR